MSAIQTMNNSLKNNKRERKTAFTFNNKDPRRLGKIKNTGFPETSIDSEEFQAFRQQMKKEKKRKDRILKIVTGVVIIIMLGVIYYLSPII